MANGTHSLRCLFTYRWSSSIFWCFKIDTRTWMSRFCFSLRSSSNHQTNYHRKRFSESPWKIWIMVEPHRNQKDTISLSILDNIFPKLPKNFISHYSHNHDINRWYSNLGSMAIHIYLYFYKLYSIPCLYLWIFHTESARL